MVQTHFERMAGLTRRKFRRPKVGTTTAAPPPPPPFRGVGDTRRQLPLSHLDALGWPPPATAKKPLRRPATAGGRGRNVTLDPLKRSGVSGREEVSDSDLDSPPASPMSSPRSPKQVPASPKRTKSALIVAQSRFGRVAQEPPAVVLMGSRKRTQTAGAFIAPTRNKEKDISDIATRAKIFSFEDTTDITTAFPIQTRVLTGPEVTRRTSEGLPRWQTPMMEAQFCEMKELFLQADGDGSGSITLHELQTLGKGLGLVVDYVVFKKMDRDRNGTVDFVEMLRCLLPNHTLRDINAMVALWGKPPTPEPSIQETPRWQDGFEPKAAEELTAVYYAMKGGAPGGLTLAELRKRTSPKYCDDDVLREVFADHDADGDGELSLQEFAKLMEDTYVFQKYHQPKPVHLHFARFAGGNRPWPTVDSFAL